MPIGKPQFTSEQYDKACYLVGRFLYHWALLEGALDTGIGKLLGMKTLEASIATTNMQARSKIHIIKTLVNLKGGESEWAKAGVKTMDAVGTLSDTRNVVAHVVFGPHESGGVRFLRVKAKGKLSYPETVYSIDDFKGYWAQATRLRQEVEALVERLTEKPSSLAALFASFATLPPNEQGHENHLGRLAQGHLDSPQVACEEDSGKCTDPED